MMTVSRSSHTDPLWPRAGSWLARLDRTDPAASSAPLALIGVPARKTSITPTAAHRTPTEAREALGRYSTFARSRGVDVSDLSVLDYADIWDPDGRSGEARVAEAVAGMLDRHQLLVALGGDNSITYSVMAGAFGDRLPECGLITVDAHHDLRDGESNGSPVRRLIDAGLPGSHIVQIGIADFSNSAQYAQRASDHGITVVDRAALRSRDLADVAAEALAIAGADGRPVYVDLDVDVCDRAAVPGCPAAAPGGISADELRMLAFLLASDSRVRVIDITEIDAEADTPDCRTVRLGALLVLEAAAGLATRLGSGSAPPQAV
jgi:formiminoglutamase